MKHLLQTFLDSDCSSTNKRCQKPAETIRKYSLDTLLDTPWLSCAPPHPKVAINIYINKQLNTYKNG